MSKNCCKKSTCKNKCICTNVPGAPGKDGLNGTTVVDDSGVPSDDAGRPGDVYVDVNNGKWYRKDTSTWNEFIQTQKVQSDGRVGIGTLTPDASAQLDVVSTDKGVLVPRMRTSEKLAITEPADGLLVYDIDLLAFSYWDGSFWKEISTSVVANSNFAEDNLTLTGDRTHDFNNDQMKFNKVDGFGIGSTASTIESSALLDLTSTTKGFLVPRMTTLQRTSITPAEGLIIYDTDLNALYVYNGTDWKDASAGDTSIYLADGDLTSNRTVSAAGNYSLTFSGLTFHRVLVDAGAGITGDYVYSTAGFGYEFSGGTTIDSQIFNLDQSGFNITYSNSTPLTDAEYLIRLRNAVASGDKEFAVNALGQLVLGALNATPNASALVDLQSTDKGFLLPRMSGAQVEAISTPATGLQVYATSAGSGDVTGEGWWGYNGSNWVQGYVSGSSIYTSDGTIGSTRVATITDTLAFTGGSIRRNVNSSKIVEVTQESDFGTVSGGNINLSNDTTYIVRGNVTCSNTLTVNGDNIAIIGFNRNLDKLIYSGTGNFINVTDFDFTLRDLWLSATTTGSLLIRGQNVTGAGFNLGRTKVLEIVNCQIRNCFDVMDIDGFDLVDISNTLFFYVQAPNIGCRFRDTSKLEFSSCELIRWFDETTTGSPSGWATCSMIELRANNLASFGAININGCVIHPQQTQNGVYIAGGSTTAFGTVAANSFVPSGLTPAIGPPATGYMFVVNDLPPELGAYSETEGLNYDISANQSIPNSTAGVLMTVVNNGTATTISSSGSLPADGYIVNTGGLNTRQEFVRWETTAAGRATYIGTKSVYVSIHATIVFTKTGATDDFEFGIYKNGTFLAPSLLKSTASSATDSVTFSYGTLISQNDYLEFYVANTSSTQNVTIEDWQVVIRE